MPGKEHKGKVAITQSAMVLSGLFVDRVFSKYRSQKNMKKNNQRKNKDNVSSLNNSYCIVLGNAGERTQGVGGQRVEGHDSKNPYYIS